MSVLTSSNLPKTKAIYTYGTMMFTVASSLYVFITSFYYGATDADSGSYFIPYAAIGLLIPIASILSVMGVGMYRTRASLSIWMTILCVALLGIGICLNLFCVWLIWISYIELSVTVGLVSFFLYKIYTVITSPLSFIHDVAGFFLSLLFLGVITVLCTSLFSTQIDVTPLFPILAIIFDFYFRKKKEEVQSLQKSFE